MICNKTRENLEILRDYLIDNYDHVSKHFDMRNYRSVYNKDYQMIVGKGFKSINDCGTHGCLAGWLPFALQKKNKLHDYDTFLNLGPFWSAFVTDVLPSSDGEKFTDNDILFEFLFDEDWVRFDNTLDGAIARIEVVLNNDFTYREQD